MIPVVIVVLTVVGTVAVVAVAARPAGEGSSVRVSVDDLATGRLPRVCVKTGEPGELLVAVEGSEGGFQSWWLLLLLLGPPGIVAVAVLWAVGRRSNRVGGQVPLSPLALDRYNGAARFARQAFGVSLAGIALGVGLVAVYLRWSLPDWASALGTALAVMAILGGIAAYALASWVVRQRWVAVSLDGSGRWAVLSDVHPNFAAALADHYRSRGSWSSTQGDPGLL